MKKRVLTGIKPTGDLHLGNYLGAIKPCLDFSNDSQYEVILMCADWHGLTDKDKVFEAGQRTLNVLAALLTFGYNTRENILILQSLFPQIMENSWYLGCATTVGLLERSHAYKDALQNNKIPTCGLLNYPVLMTSDIVSFDADFVPVGQDQTQHLEYASDMVKLFNNMTKKSIFKEPKGIIQTVPLLPGIDGDRKMSKSYDNYIPLFGSPKEIEKRIKAIKTDSKGLNDPKDPSTCLIFQLLKSFASKEATDAMHAKLTKGTGYGYGHAKMDFIEEHQKVFGSKQELYHHYLNSPQEIWKQMEQGHGIAQKYADVVLARSRSALGLVSFR